MHESQKRNPKSRDQRVEMLVEEARKDNDARRVTITVMLRHSGYHFREKETEAEGSPLQFRQPSHPNRGGR